MELKPQTNRSRYLQVLRRMTPAQRLAKAIELSDLGKRLFLHGLRKRFRDADEKQIHALYLSRIARCHNRNY
ncbi:MAG TPA: hypothetical protein VGF52_05500 [Tepidisphaeraceae bacterium]